METSQNQGVEAPNAGQDLSSEAISPRGAGRETRLIEHLVELLKAEKIEEFNSERPATSLSFVKRDLSGLNLSGVNLENCDLGGANLKGTKFIGAKLKGACFNNCELTGADFSRAGMHRVSLFDAEGDQVNFEEATLDHANLANATLTNSHFKNAHLVDADLTAGDFTGSDFFNADARSLQATRAEFQKCVFEFADLSDAKLLRASLVRARGLSAKLTGARLTAADLSGAKFEDADLVNTRLELTTFNNTSFTGSNLTGAVFVQAMGDAPDFSKTICVGARFTRALLYNGIFKEAWIRGTLTEGVAPSMQVFNGANLSEEPPQSAYPVAGRKNGDSETRGISISETGINREELDKALDELYALVGLDAIKRRIEELTAFLTIQVLRGKSNLPELDKTLHFVMRGPPGVGKTSVARILSKILKSLTFLKKGHLVEAAREDLVAGFEGQTAEKTAKVVESALDGLLLVDEVYTLTQGGQKGFGPEAAATLLKKMEDNRDRLVVAITGYTEETNDFIESNPGFKRRFTEYIDFPAYTGGELMEITRRTLKQKEFIFDAETRGYLDVVLNLMVLSGGRHFGNAGEARNLFEDMTVRQALRINGQQDLSRRALQTLAPSDIPFEKFSPLALKEIPLADLKWKYTNPDSGLEEVFGYKQLALIQIPDPSRRMIGQKYPELTEESKQLLQSLAAAKGGKK